jgi:hypothetical protein
MRSIFGNQYILVSEGALKLFWCDEMEAIERNASEARKRQRREKCRKLVKKARQEALKNTHKLQWREASANGDG